MDSTELIKKVRRIEIKTKGLSKHIFSGEYHSAFKGRGMSFSEVRDYHYGDDVRNIDWNVTARYGETQIKVFEEEREMTMMLLVDMSSSSLYGTQSMLKSDLIAELSAVLAFSASTNNDKVGAILFSDRIEKYIPPKKGRQTILRIIREILNHKVEGKGTNISQALKYFSNIQKKRTVSFLISDFIDSDYKLPLSVASKRHDIIGMHIYDKGERDIPNVGIIKAYDIESGSFKYINTYSKKVRNRYAESFDNAENEVKDIFKKSGSDFISVHTEEDYVKTLLKFFKSRNKR